MNSLENQVLLTKIRAEGGAYRVPPSLLLRVSGKDAFRYLNSQITADLHKLSLGNSLKACLLSPKGRLVALLNIWMREEVFFIETDITLQEIVVERLERYVVADDVSFEVMTPPASIHLFGNVSKQSQVQEVDGILISRLGFPGKDLDISDFSSLTFLTPYAPVNLLSMDFIEILRIEQQIPRWGFEITAQTLPPEARLERDCIDYEKGCYLGQEIISRLKSLGHVNRLLYAFSSEEEVTSDMSIYSQEDSMLPLGKITSAGIQYDSKRFIALGYLSRGSERASAFFAKSCNADIKRNISLTYKV